ncbi:hypothetical protein [Actinocorallia populi]|uniref:hypothetical protein n=1 Tax=Actinocorallia populi TaxID=2079200 RepID=UPI000D090824|nr:hypothetical protein [Actinocorallia populi]
MRFRVKAAVMLAAAALALPVTVIGAASPAFALPADCTAQVERSRTPNGTLRTVVTRNCASGTGQYRGMMKCLNSSHGFPVLSTKYSQWVDAGPHTSVTLTCIGVTMGGDVELRETP